MEIDRQCKECSSYIPSTKQPKSGRPLIYCSKKCRLRHYHRIYPKPPYKPVEKQEIIKICKSCGKEFRTLYPTKLCCSSLCKTHLGKLPCAVCGFSDPRAIHLHHINRKQKSGLMSLCANHHYIYHSIIGWNGTSEHKTRQEVISIIKRGVLPVEVPQIAK